MISSLRYPEDGTFRDYLSHFTALLDEPPINKTIIEHIANFIICACSYVNKGHREPAKFLVSYIEKTSKERWTGSLALLRLWLAYRFNQDFGKSSLLRKLLRLISKLQSTLRGSETKRDELNKLKLTVISEHQKKQKDPLFRGLITTQIASIRDITEFEPSVIAEQLTLLEFDMFKQIKLGEFVQPSTSPRISEMIKRSNQLSYWVATNILKREQIQDQVQMINYFLSVVENCERLGNYNSAMNIINSFNFNFISRLLPIWQLKPKLQALLDRFLEFSSPISGFGNYREVYSKRKELLIIEIPMMPYIGVLIRDMTLINEGNPGLIDQRINLQKLHLLLNKLREIKIFQSLSYDNLISIQDPVVIGMLVKLDHWSEEILIEKSEQLKTPRKSF